MTGSGRSIDAYLAFSGDHCNPDADGFNVRMLKNEYLSRVKLFCNSNEHTTSSSMVVIQSRQTFRTGHWLVWPSCNVTMSRRFVGACHVGRPAAMRFANIQ